MEQSLPTEWTVIGFGEQESLLFTLNVVRACTKRTKSLFPPPLVGGGQGEGAHIGLSLYPWLTGKE